MEHAIGPINTLSCIHYLSRTCHLKHPIGSLSRASGLDTTTRYHCHVHTISHTCPLPPPSPPLSHVPPPSHLLSRSLWYASGHHYPESFSYTHIIIITLTCPPPPPSNVPLSRSLGYASGHHYPGCHDRPGLPAFRETKRFEKGVRGDPPSALSICTPTYITSFKKVIRSNIHNPLYVYHLNHSMHVSVVSVNPQSPPHPPPPPTHPFTLRASSSHHRISIPIVCRISDIVYYYQENSDELLALPLVSALLEHPIPTTTIALAERVRTCYLQVTPCPVLSSQT